MSEAAALLLVLPLLMAALAAWLLVSGLRARRRPWLSRTAAHLRVAAGLALLIGLGVAVLGLVLPVQYGIVIFPFLGLVLALLLAVPLTIASTVVELRWQRGQRAEGSGRG